MVSAEQGARRQSHSLLQRVLNLSLVIIAIAVSLLVFPSVLLWMVAAWLAIGSWQILRGRSSWLPLAACVAVLVIKRPDWSPAMMLLGVALVAAAVLFLWRGRRSARESFTQKAARLTIGVVWLVWLIAVWESYESCHARRPLSLHPMQPIVCVGDSLTTGLTTKEAYPDYLQELVSVPVVNLGRAGVTARDMTKHLPEILERQPQGVVIEFGGHDFLRGYGRESTRESLLQIIEACRAAGAKVVLMEIPRGFITDPFSGLERELAREYDLELIPDSTIRMLVVRSPAIPLVGDVTKPHWSDDGLHPNVDGARMMADVVYRALQGIYGPTITAERPGTPRAGSQ
ncbi:MAG: GDSL-type esterase/lipase family protein [Pirellulales bacterium]